MKGLPRFSPRSPGARAAADARRAAKPIEGTIQTGQYPDFHANSSQHAENTGENRRLQYLRANNNALVLEHPELLLDSADNAGFTLSNPMALPPDPVPVDPSLWRAVFPRHLDATIAKAGRWMFRGKPPSEAFGRGAAEVAKAMAAACPSDGRNDRLRLAEVWPDDADGNPSPHVLDVIDDVRSVVAAHFHDLRGFLPARGEERDDDVLRVANEAMAFSSLRSDIPEEAALVWDEMIFRRLGEEDDAVAAMENDLDRSLLAAAAEWKTAPGQYHAEEETPAEGENVHILTNEKLRIVRELTAVWPDDAVWPRTAWSDASRAAVAAAERLGDGPLGQTMRTATIAAAADSILTLADDMQDYREDGGGENARPLSRRQRVIRGTLDEVTLASPNEIPARARDVFRNAARRHCERLLEEHRQAEAYRQRSEIAEAEASAKLTEENDRADRTAAMAHAAGNASG